MPYARNPFFTGRDQILLDLHGALRGDGAAALSQAIRGLGGIGKTQTAVEYAYRYGQGRDAVYDWVFWVRAETGLSLAQDFGAIAQQVGVATAGQKTEELVQAAKRWLNTHGAWLLVFDNADDPGLLKGYRPSNADGRVLLTSRAQSFGVVGIGKAFALESLAPADAEQFLWARVGRELSRSADDETEAVAELAEELGYLPLALEQAGAYVAQMGTSFGNYLVSYRRRELKLLEKQGPETGDYPNSVATTWLLNFEAVEQQSGAAARVLELSAFLASDEIPYELLVLGREAFGLEIAAALAEVAEEPLVLDELLAPLARFSLITLEAEKSCYGIHRMVQAVVRDGLVLEEHKAWLERAVAGFNAVFPEVKFENWERCRRLVKHGEALYDHRPEDSEAWALLLNEVGIYFYYQAEYQRGVTCIKRSLEIREAQLGPEHPSTATSLNNLAELYRSMGRYGEAEPLYARSLEISEAQLGPEYPSTATSLNNLAGLYELMGRYGEAEPLYARSLEIREAQLGPDHPSTATSLNNLAGLYYALERYSEVEPLFLRAMQIDLKAIGENHPDTAIDYVNLAGLYTQLERYAEAEPLYHRAIQVFYKSLGEDHPNTTASFNGLANLIITAFQAGKVAELSDHPMTQNILQQVQQQAES